MCEKERERESESERVRECENERVRQREKESVCERDRERERERETVGDFIRTVVLEEHNSPRGIRTFPSKIRIMSPMLWVGMCSSARETKASQRELVCLCLEAELFDRLFAT